MDCEGCYLDKLSGVHLSKNQIIDFAVMLKNLGYQGITLSGGDPLTRDDIVEIVVGLSELGFDIHLDTTGRTLDRFSKDQLDKLSKSISMIGIPIDGHDNKTAILFRTNQNKFLSEVKETLTLLDGYNSNISINTVVHNKNKDILNEILTLIENFKSVKRWELHQFVSISNKSRAVSGEFEISDGEFLAVTNKLSSTKGLDISQKPSARKLSFKYLDFNGDLVLVKNGQKSIVGNILNCDKSKVVRFL